MHRKEVTHSNGSYEWKSRRWARLIIWDKVKVPLQSDAPEESDLLTAWQLFLLDDSQTCHSKDWVGDREGDELLYNSVKTEVRQLEIRRSYRRDVIGKATSGRRGIGALMSWGPEKLLIRCSRSPSRVGLLASGWAALENKKDTTLTAIRVGVNILQFCGVSNSLSHANVTNKVRGTYFYKAVFLHLLLLCHCDSFCMYVDDNTTLTMSFKMCIWLAIWRKKMEMFSSFLL